MVNDEKLMGLAQNLEDTINDPQTPTDVYIAVMEYAKTHKDYFISYLGVKSLIKLTIYIWSLKKTQGFELANKIFSELGFLILFSHDGTNYESECNNCSANGYVECEDCEGAGTETCDKCEGDGKITCNNCDEGYVTCGECDGEGKIDDEEEDESRTCEECDGSGIVPCDECGGKEEKTCPDCDGEGTQECYTCDGRGNQDCDECNGTGEIESDNIVFTITQIISWNPDLNYRAMRALTSGEPLMDTDDLIDFEGSYILMRIEDDYAENNMEMNDDVEENTFYVVDVDDDPEIQMYGNKLYWNYSRRQLNNFGYL